MISLFRFNRLVLAGISLFQFHSSLFFEQAIKANLRGLGYGG